VRRTVEAGEATAQASVADLEAAKLSAQARLAEDYFLLRTQDAQIRLLADTVDAYQKSLQLTRNQYAVGVAARADVAQAETQLKSTQAQALDAGVQAAMNGNHLGDIGAAVQQVVERAGFSVVRDLVGHGIGTGFHEEPQVPNYGKPSRGLRLVPGLTIAIEPMVNVGKPGIRTMPDKWTVVTVDGGRSAHFEHTVAITENGPRILTAA
jgi:methionine aminopeptidase type I